MVLGPLARSLRTSHLARCQRLLYILLHDFKKFPFRAHFSCLAEVFSFTVLHSKAYMVKRLYVPPDLSPMPCDCSNFYMPFGIRVVQLYHAELLETAFSQLKQPPAAEDWITYAQFQNVTPTEITEKFRFRNDPTTQKNSCYIEQVQHQSIKKFLCAKESVSSKPKERCGLIVAKDFPSQT